MKKIMNLAKSVFRVSLRDKLFWTLFFVAIVILGVSCLLASISMDNKVKAISNFSLFMINLVSVFLVITMSIFNIRKEIDGKSYHVLLTRGFTRFQYYLGNLLGYFLIGFIFMFVSYLMLFIILKFYGTVSPIFWYGILFYSLELFLVSIISTGSAIIFYHLNLSLMLPIFIYVVGNIMTTAKLAVENEEKLKYLKSLVISISGILPNLSYYKIANWISANIFPSLDYVAGLIFYTLAFSVAYIYVFKQIIEEKDLI